MGPPRVIGGYGVHKANIERTKAASMGPPRVIGGYVPHHLFRVHAPAASMGPPRVIGGYDLPPLRQSSSSNSFNGAAESNRRIRTPTAWMAS